MEWRILDAIGPFFHGISVWCQTGGWHGFRRLAFLEDGRRDIWIRLNVPAAIRILCDGASVEQVVREEAGTEHADAMLELLRHSETVVRELYYIEDFARRKLFFRRVRIPPLLHVFWDRLFTLGLLGILYRLLRPAAGRSLPKFLRKSAMGIDTLFK